ncbi:hypothetical protein BKI52_05105 [marine bacterium AO1-C]|nr:hypothetical protein BKI52_05105 [marine bacterium AO1-C]
MAFRREYGRINVEVTVKRTDLIDRLKKNREKHQREFQQAIALWQQDLAEAIKNLDVANQTEFPKDISELEEHCPESYIEAYDDIIEMFSMAIKEEVLLDSDAFRNFCRDEWDWKSDVADNKYYHMVLKKK